MSFYSLLDDFNLRERWKIFGDSISYNVVSSLNSNMGRASASLTAYNLFNFNITGTRRTFIDSFSRFYYWKFLPLELWRHKLYLTLSVLKFFKFIISPSINILLLSLIDRFPFSLESVIIHLWFVHSKSFFVISFIKFFSSLSLKDISKKWKIDRTIIRNCRLSFIKINPW